MAVIHEDFDKCDKCFTSWPSGDFESCPTCKTLIYELSSEKMYYKGEQVKIKSDNKLQRETTN